MPRLILMRHGRALDTSPDGTDHGRPLHEEGRAQASQRGRDLVDRDWFPALALVSDAARTEETWAWVADEVGPVDLDLQPRLYNSGTTTHLDCLSRDGLPDCVLLLAHNPGISGTASLLTSSILRFSTGDAVLLEHSSPWPIAADALDWTLVAHLTSHPS